MFLLFHKEIIRMFQGDIFSLSWSIDSNNTIRIYGLNENNENTCLIVDNYTPYIYIELPNYIKWDDSKVILVVNKINSRLNVEHRPISFQFVWKKKLNYTKLENEVNLDNLDKFEDSKLYPFLLLNFNHYDKIRYLCSRLRFSLDIPEIGCVKLIPHKNNISPILQLTSLQKIPTAGWISFKGKEIVNDKSTYCTHEYQVSWKDLYEKKSDRIVKPLLMSFEIKTELIPKEIFEIYCVFGREGNYEKVLITLSKTEQNEIKCIRCDTETELLCAFTKLIQERQPNIIVGYNIFNFDIPYMITRAKECLCFWEFSRQGMDKLGNVKERKIYWNNSAYNVPSFEFLEVEGRIFIDQHDIIRREYQTYNNFKLKTITSIFVKETEKYINKISYFIKRHKHFYSDIIYTILNYLRLNFDDYETLLRFFEKMTLKKLYEKSNLINIPIFYLDTGGHRIKLLSRLYKKYTHENTVLVKDRTDFF
jgi:DNA polymerase elongation subunit (family B)